MEPITVATDSREYVDREYSRCFQSAQVRQRARVISFDGAQLTRTGVTSSPSLSPTPSLPISGICMCGYIEWKLPAAANRTATSAVVIGDAIQVDFDYRVMDDQ
jgi:hypothetical protein